MGGILGMENWQNSGMDFRESNHITPDALTAESAYFAALNHLARIVELTKELMESAKISFAGGDAAEIEEVKRDAAFLIERHLAGNKAVHETGLEYCRETGAPQLNEVGVQ